MQQTDIHVKVYKTLADAVAQTPNYTAPEYQLADLSNVVVIKNIANSGIDTADFIFTDEKGQKHVALITVGLLRRIIETVDATLNNQKRIPADVN
ncbi:MAG: hypothetical protein AB7U43_12985 [Desulfobacter sp.]